MDKKRKKITLDKDEQAIEMVAESYIPVSRKERKEIEGTLERVRKTRNVNIRISEAVLESLQRRSREEGIPYQTLISSVLHKYVTHRLVEEEAIRKSLKLFQSNY
jgi:predicted DNA binding CopG/RHH family protein